MKLLQQIIPAECESTTLEKVSELRDRGFVFEEKKDGVRALLHIGMAGAVITGRSFLVDCTLRQTEDQWPEIRDYAFYPSLKGHIFDGELMSDGSYWVFDLPASPLTLTGRRLALKQLCNVFPPWMKLLPQSTDADQLLAAAERGLIEGIVVKRQSSKYGFGWWKAKRTETYDVCVEAIHDGGSVSVSEHGKDCGCVSGVPESVAVGDIIEVSCFSRFTSGRFRSGRFIRFRPDKM